MVNYTSLSFWKVGVELCCSRDPSPQSSYQHFVAAFPGIFLDRTPREPLEPTHSSKKYSSRFQYCKDICVHSVTKLTTSSSLVPGFRRGPRAPCQVPSVRSVPSVPFARLGVVRMNRGLGLLGKHGPQGDKLSGATDQGGDSDPKTKIQCLGVQLHYVTTTL